MMEAGIADASLPTQAEAGQGPAIAMEITSYTDPLCCWSWGFEPQLRRLRYAFAGRIAWRTRMGGMIGDWAHFGDPINAVHRPSQMGPLWLQAKHVTGMPIEADIWVKDPPASSWPSCLAVKAAELQSGIAADLYLRRLREAVMVESRNIARDEVLQDLATELAAMMPGLFDAERFRSDFSGEKARKELEDDIREARFRGIGRFPCLVLRRPRESPVYLVGWRPYPVLRDALVALVPDFGEERQPRSAEDYRTYWTRITDREVAEACSGPGAPEPSPLPGATSSGFGE